MVHAVCEEQGPRHSMEDTHFVSQDLLGLRQDLQQGSNGSRVSFFGVYDGHCGRRAAEYCQSHLHHNVLDSLSETSDWSEALFNG